MPATERNRVTNHFEMEERAAERNKGVSYSEMEEGVVRKNRVADLLQIE